MGIAYNNTAEIGDLVDSVSETFDFKKDSLVFLNTSDVHLGKVLKHSYVSKAGLPGQAKKRIRKGDILFSEIRPANGHFAKIDFDADDYVVSTKLMVLRLKSQICDPTFFYIFLTSKAILSELQSIAEHRSGTFPQITFDQLKKIKIILPPLPEQRAISRILFSLDEKIELNNKMNKALQNLAQSIFKQWFIDFEFPDQEGKPYKSTGGKMAYNKVLSKEIPDGWEVRNLAEISVNFDSKRIPLSSRQRESMKGNYPYYGAVGIVDYIDGYLFDGIYLLMSEDGAYVVDENGFPTLQLVRGKFWVNNHAHILQGKLISTELLFLLLKNTNVGHIVTGAVQPKINQGNMNCLKFALPDEGTMKILQPLVYLLLEKIAANEAQNQVLRKIRDLLLPKLMSGKIRVLVNKENLEVT